ncbi:TraX family protein [Peptostreptococcus stomatis]|uniref:TraX family protein n=1 Tax=Peptostreptococcus stomatis TaxID=341694 RepID=UPI003FA08BC0
MYQENIKGYKANAFQIKLFMASLMVLDHLPHIPGLVPPLWEGIFHVMTRCVGAWFAFNAVEGFLHTRNQTKYNIRLFVWATFMQLGNFLIEFLLKSKDIHVNNNIFLTLALGVLLLNIISRPIKKATSQEGLPLKFLRVVLGAIVLLIGIMLSEGGLILIPFMLITYIFRNSPKKRNVVYTIATILLAAFYLNGAFIYDSLRTNIEMILFNSDWFFISVLPFLYLYNGQRGKNSKFTKYFFYVFYPAHLWIIAIISYFFK